MISYASDNMHFMIILYTTNANCVALSLVNVEIVKSLLGTRRQSLAVLLLVQRVDALLASMLEREEALVDVLRLLQPPPLVVVVSQPPPHAAADK